MVGSTKIQTISFLNNWTFCRPPLQKCLNFFSRPNRCAMFWNVYINNLQISWNFFIRMFFSMNPTFLIISTLEVNSLKFISKMQISIAYLFDRVKSSFDILPAVEMKPAPVIGNESKRIIDTKLWRGVLVFYFTRLGQVFVFCLAHTHRKIFSKSY